ncbi:MAG TPA: tetratricopeptide repeat protein [Myxococcales bacterium]|nr:tetratricopeptide repeat protein [Myxococcales bacterium]
MTPALLQRRLPAIALLAVVAAAAAYLIRRPPEALMRMRMREAPPVIPPKGKVAILRFDARGAPSFPWLDTGVADLLSRDLEGGALQPADASSVLTFDLDKACAAAAARGAGYFLGGRVLEKPDELLLEGALYDATTGALVSQGVARGSPSKLLEIVRAFSDQLQGLRRGPGDAQARLAALALRTSSSPEALQAWLQGEQILRGERSYEAAPAFQRAVTADPAFAFAHFRLGNEALFDKSLFATDEFFLALRHADRLSRMEQLIAEGWLQAERGLPGEAEQIFATATREFPAEPRTWHALSELQFHEGSLRRHPPQEALPALERTVALDPDNIDALGHLLDLAQLRGDRQAVMGLSSHLLTLLRDPMMVMSFNLVRALEQGDKAEHDRIFARVPLAQLSYAFNRAAWQLDPWDAGPTLTARSPDRDGFPYATALDLLHGKPDAARRVLQTAIAAHPSGDSAYFGTWVDARPEFGISPVQLKAARATAASLEIANRDPIKVPGLRYLRGLLALRAKDFRAAEGAARSLAAMPELEGASIGKDLALALRARALFQRGKPKEALAVLDRQELRIPMRYLRLYAGTGESFLRAGLLEALHRPREALPLYDALVFYSNSEPSFFALAHLFKARIHDQLGEHEAAVQHYAAFAEAWKDCEPVGQPELHRVQERLATLRGAWK